MREIKTRALSHLSQDDLAPLLEPRPGPCVSISLPVEWGYDGALQAPIRLKNLLGEAEERLVASGVRSLVAKEILDPVARLRSNADVWRNAEGGLAAFCAQDFFQYHLVPGTIEQRVTVAPLFHIRPLLPFVTRQGPYFVLALSEKLRRLLRADGARTREIELRGAPRDVEDANRFDDPERYIGFHTRTPGGSPGGERRPAMFHGHGAARDAANAERQQYARLIARSVYREIGSESAPLVLVGSEQMVSAFRSFNEYPHLVDDDVITSPDLLSDDELRERAWPAVAPIFERERRDLIERFHQSLGTGLASDRIGEIISAAHQGRVGAVIVTERAAPRGRVDLDTGDARFVSHKNTEGADLVDYAVVLTLKNRGRVLWATTEEARIDAPIVAIYRY